MTPKYFLGMGFQLRCGFDAIRIVPRARIPVARSDPDSLIAEAAIAAMSDVYP
jgi:hypothetical protein